MPREMGRPSSSNLRRHGGSGLALARTLLGAAAFCLLGSCALPEASVDESSASGAGGGGPACTAAGLTCQTTSQCCQSGDGIGAEGSVCGSDGLCHAGCTTNSQCKSFCCTPLPGQTAAVCAKANYCGGAALGAVCSNNSECSSGLCVNGGSGTGWCSRTCTGQADCPNEPLMVCEPNKSGSEICWVTCSDSGDCSKYGSQLSCVPNGSFEVCAT